MTKKQIRIEKLPFTATYSPKWQIVPVSGEGVTCIWFYTKQEAEKSASEKGWFIIK